MDSRSTTQAEQATLRFLEHPEYYARHLQLRPDHKLVKAANTFHKRIEETLSARLNPESFMGEEQQTPAQQSIREKASELNQQYQLQEDILNLATKLDCLYRELEEKQAAAAQPDTSVAETQGEAQQSLWGWLLGSQKTPASTPAEKEVGSPASEALDALSRQLGDILESLKKLGVNVDHAVAGEGQTESPLVQSTQQAIASLKEKLGAADTDYRRATATAVSAQTERNAFAVAAETAGNEESASQEIKSHFEGRPEDITKVLQTNPPSTITPEAHHARHVLARNADELLVDEFKDKAFQETLTEKRFAALSMRPDIREAIRAKINEVLHLPKNVISDDFLTLFLENTNCQMVIAFLYGVHRAPQADDLTEEENALLTYLDRHRSETHKAAHQLLFNPAFRSLPNHLKLIGMLCQDRLEHKSRQRKLYGFFRHNQRQRSYEALAALRYEKDGLDKVLFDVGASTQVPNTHTYHAITFAQLGMQCGLQRFLRHTRINDPVDIFQIYLDGGVDAIADEVIYQLDACREQGITDPEQLQRIAQTYLDYMVAVHPHSAMVKPVVAAHRQVMIAKIAEHLKPNKQELLAPGKSILRKTSLKIVKPYKSQSIQGAPDPYLNTYVDQEPDPTKTVPVHPSRHSIFKKHVRFAEEASTASYTAYPVETTPQEQLSMREAKAEVKSIFEAIDREESPQENKEESYELQEQEEATFEDIQTAPAQLEAARHYLQAHPRWASKSQYLKDAFINKFEKAESNEQKLMAALEAIRFFASLKGHYEDALFFIEKINDLPLSSLTSSAILDSRFQELLRDLEDNKKYHKFARSERATGVERLYQQGRREDLSTPVKLLIMSAVAHGRSQIESLGRSSETKALYDRMSRFDEMPVSRRIESLLDTDMTSLVGPTNAQAEDDDPRYDPKLVLNALYHQRYSPSTKNTLPYYSFTFVNQQGRRRKTNGFSVFARIAANPTLTNREKILTMIHRGRALYSHNRENDVLRKLAECALPRDENGCLKAFLKQFPRVDTAPNQGNEDGHQATI